MKHFTFIKINNPLSVINSIHFYTFGISHKRRYKDKLVPVSGCRNISFTPTRLHISVVTTYIIHLCLEAGEDFVALGQRLLKFFKLLRVEVQLLL